MSSDEPGLIGIGAQFATSEQLLACREEIKNGAAIRNVSLFHMANLPYEGASKDHPDTTHFLVAVTPEGKQIQLLIEKFEEHEGEPWEPPNEVVKMAIARRMRKGIEALASGEKELSQTENYGEGARINELGDVEPYKPDLDKPPPTDVPIGPIPDLVEGTTVIDPNSPEADTGIQGLCRDAMVALRMRAQHEGYDVEKLGILIIAVEDESEDETEAGLAVETREEHGGLRLALAAAEVMAKDSGIPMHFETRKESDGDSDTHEG